MTSSTAAERSERRAAAKAALSRYGYLALKNELAAEAMEAAAERAEEANAAMSAMRTPQAREAAASAVDAAEEHMHCLARRIAENMEQMAAVEALVSKAHGINPLAGKVLALRYLGSLSPIEGAGKPGQYPQLCEPMREQDPLPALSTPFRDPLTTLSR